MVGVSRVSTPVLVAPGQSRSQSSSIAGETAVIACQAWRAGFLPISGIGR